MISLRHRGSVSVGVVVLLCSILFPILTLFACSRDGGGASVPDAAEAGSAQGLTAETINDYVILRADEAPRAGIVNGMTLREAFETAGYSLKLSTDFYKEGVPGMEILPHEILVGETNREESIAFLDSLAPWQWGYALIGEKIVIAGHSDEATAEAVDAFITSVVNHSPFSFAEGDRYVFGDIAVGEGREFTVLSAYEDGENGLDADSILTAVREYSPEIVIRVRITVDEADTADLLKDALPDGYAVGFSGVTGEGYTEIYYLTSAYTFSAGEQARLLSYPNLTTAEQGAMAYTVLRCRDTGKKMIFAAAALPDDTYSSARLRTVTAFLSHATTYPVALCAAGMNTGSKTSTAEDDLFAAGYAPAHSIAQDRTGDADPDADLFFPFERTAVTQTETLSPGLKMTVFQKAAE